MDQLRPWALVTVILVASLSATVFGDYVPSIAPHTTSTSTPSSTTSSTSTSSTTSTSTFASPSPADLETTTTTTTTKHQPPYGPKKTPKPKPTPMPTPADLETSPIDFSTPSIAPETDNETTTESVPAVETSEPSVVDVESTTDANEFNTTANEPFTIEPIEITDSTSAFNSSDLPIETLVPVESSPSTPASPGVTEETGPSTETPIVETIPEVTVVPVAQQTGNRRPQPAATLPPVDFDCKKKADGYYPDSKDKCSSIFYACVGGLARQLSCGTGLVYEPDSGSCERRHESFRCTGTRKTTLPTTPRRPPPPPVKLIIDCTKLDDGWYADPQRKCSRAFYSCSNGAGSRFDCPGNMYFDVDSTACQPYGDVFACSGKKPTPTKPATSPLPRAKLPVDCENLSSGMYADPSSKCSRVFYVCSNGDGYKQTCPDNLYFDTDELLCGFFDEVFVCSGKAKRNSTSISPPIPTIASLPSTEYNCTGKPDRPYLLESNKCSNSYYRCAGGFTYKLKCPEGLFFDLENDICDRYASVFACSGKKGMTYKPITYKPVPTEKVPVDCNKLRDGDYADPGKKCSSIYFTCSNTIGMRRACPHGTFFDSVYSVCDSREYVQDCNGKPRPSTPKPTTRHPTSKAPYNCEKNSDGNYQAGKCESRYYACVSGTAIVSDCPRGTYYDSELDQCGYKEEIPSCGGARPTKTPKAAEKP